MKKNVSRQFFPAVIAVFCFLLGCSLFLDDHKKPDGGNQPDADPEVVDVEPQVNDLLSTSDLDGDGIPNSQDTDIDGDGLSNALEDLWGTSTYHTDTDGDQWTDWEEIQNFDATDIDLFNPLIADLPRIQVVITQKPILRMRYSINHQSTESVSTSTSTEIGRSRSTGKTDSFSTAMEHGWSVEAGIEAKLGVSLLGPEAETTWSVKVGASGSYSSSDTYEYSYEETEERSDTYETAEALETSNGFAFEGGVLRAAVKFVNNGNLAYTAQSLTLNASTVDYGRADYLTLVGNLDMQGVSGFAPFTLAPGSESGEYIFENAALTVDDYSDIFGKQNGLMINVAGHRLTAFASDGAEVDFTGAWTRANARTAMVIIDYGPGQSRNIEQYRIATKTHLNPAATDMYSLFDPVPLSEIMTTAGLSLGTTYTVDDTGGLSSVRGVESTARSGWVVVRVYTADGLPRIDLYSSSVEPYDFRSLSLRTGDTLELIYSSDADGDGLYNRIETVLGTSDASEDSDGDTLNDREEYLEYGTNPASSDTDGDGLSDDVDADPLSPPISSDASLSALTVSEIDANGNVRESHPVSLEESENAYAISVIHSRLIAVTATATAGEVYELSVTPPSAAPQFLPSGGTTDPITVSLGSNVITVRVVADDQSTTRTYQVTVPVAVPTLKSLSVNQFGTDENSLQVYWEPPVSEDRDWYTGLIIFRSKGALGFTPEENTVYEEGKDVLMARVFRNAPTTSEGKDTELERLTSYTYTAYCFYKEGAVNHYGAPVTATNATVGANAVLELAILSMNDLCSDGTDDNEFEVHISVNNLGNAAQKGDVVTLVIDGNGNIDGDPFLEEDAFSTMNTWFWGWRYLVFKDAYGSTYGPRDYERKCHLPSFRLDWLGANDAAIWAEPGQAKVASDCYPVEFDVVCPGTSTSSAVQMRIKIWESDATNSVGTLVTDSLFSFVYYDETDKFQVTYNKEGGLLSPQTSAWNIDPFAASNDYSYMVCQFYGAGFSDDDGNGGARVVVYVRWKKVYN